MSKLKALLATPAASRSVLGFAAEGLLLPVRLIEHLRLLRLRHAHPRPAFKTPSPSLLGFLIFSILLSIPAFWLFLPLFEQSLQFFLVLPLLPATLSLASLFERVRVGAQRFFLLEVLPEHALKVEDLKSTFGRIKILSTHPLLSHQPNARRIFASSSNLHDDLLNDFRNLCSYAMRSTSSLSVSLRALELDRRLLIMAEAEEALVFMLKEAQHLALQAPLGAVSEASAAHLSSLLTNSEFSRFCHQQNRLSSI